MDGNKINCSAEYTNSNGIRRTDDHQAFHSVVAVCSLSVSASLRTSSNCLYSETPLISLADSFCPTTMTISIIPFYMPLSSLTILKIIQGYLRHPPTSADYPQAPDEHIPMVHLLPKRLRRIENNPLSAILPLPYYSQSVGYTRHMC